MRSVPRSRLDLQCVGSKQRGTRPPRPCAPTRQRPRAPSPATLTPPGLRGVCGSSAPGSLAADSRLGFDSGQGPDPAASPAVRTAAVSAGSLHPSVQGSGCLGRARSSRRRHPSPAGKAGTRAWEAGRGGGEARRSPRPAGRGRRAVSLARGPGLPGGPGRGRPRGWWPGPDTRNAARDSVRGGGARPHADEVTASPGLDRRTFSPLGSVSHLAREGPSPTNV